MAPDTASRRAPRIAGCSRSNAAQNWASSWRRSSEILGSSSSIVRSSRSLRVPRTPMPLMTIGRQASNSVSSSFS